MRDMGLFVSMLEDGTQYDILQGNLYGYKGAIFENLIADIFSKMGRCLWPWFLGIASAAALWYTAVIMEEYVMIPIYRAARRAGLPA